VKQKVGRERRFFWGGELRISPLLALLPSVRILNRRFGGSGGFWGGEWRGCGGETTPLLRGRFCGRLLGVLRILLGWGKAGLGVWQTRLGGEKTWLGEKKMSLGDRKTSLGWVQICLGEM
jgi:hypothetical protein